MKNWRGAIWMEWLEAQPVLLTTWEESHLPDDELGELAMARAECLGLTLYGGIICMAAAGAFDMHPWQGPGTHWTAAHPRICQ